MAYNSYRSQDVMTPYTTQLCGLSGAMAAAFTSIRYYGTGFGAILGGLVGNKLGSSNTVSLGFLLVIITNVLFLVFPGTPATVGLIVTLMLTFMLAHYAMRGLYYALLGEGLVPVAATGVATGIIATFAYTPDFFAPLYQGALLDAFGKDVHTGYNYIFIISAISAACGIVLCRIFNHSVKRKIAALKEAGIDPFAAKEN
jgi:Sugar phosphate permease